MFSIYDGREKFFQWDKDRQLIVEDKAITQVHFANCLCPNATVCEVKDGVADVPNELLTQDLDIRVWAYDGEMTKHEQVFEVEKRTKPADYIYTQTEVWTAEKAVEEALAAAKANGDFKGDKGDKGDAGVINFVVVSELPATGSGDSIYLVPNATGENNNFDEYIWQNGAWEKIGSAGVEVNLDEYVKNTDYATQTTAGLVKGSVAFGTYIGTGGIIDIQKATNEEIDAKSQTHKPITPSNLDYAVKKSLADNKLEWTDEEKAAAREQIGAYSKDTVEGNYLLNNNKIMGLDNSGNEVSFKLDMANSSFSIPIRETGYQLTVGTPTTEYHATTKKYVDEKIANVASNIFVANPDTTWQEIDDAYNAGKYIFYAVEAWGIMNLIPLIQRGSNEEYIFTHLRENKYLYTVKVNKDNTRGIGSTYVVDKLDFDALVARVEALEGK